MSQEKIYISPVYDILIIHLKYKFLGGDKCRVTPVSIPNTEVKFALPMILVWQRTGKAGAARFILKG
jgi:hypothetical protein